MKDIYSINQYFLISWQFIKLYQTKKILDLTLNFFKDTQTHQNKSAFLSYFSYPYSFFKKKKIFTLAFEHTKRTSVTSIGKTLLCNELVDWLQISWCRQKSIIAQRRTKDWYRTTCHLLENRVVLIKMELFWAEI